MKISVLEKTCACYHQLDSFPVLKDTFDEISDDACKFVLILYNEIVNIWKICII